MHLQRNLSLGDVVIRLVVPGISVPGTLWVSAWERGWGRLSYPPPQDPLPLRAFEPGFLRRLGCSFLAPLGQVLPPSRRAGEGVSGFPEDPSIYGGGGRETQGPSATGTPTRPGPG